MSIEKWYWEMTVKQRRVVWVFSFAFCVFMGLTLAGYSASHLYKNAAGIAGVGFFLALAMPVLGCLLYAHLGKEKYLRK